MNLNITVISEGVGFQIFDAWYAYRQSRNNYDAKINISYSSTFRKNHKNILLECMPDGTHIDKYKDYDKIFFCNSNESLFTCATDTMYNLKNADNVFYITNSIIDDSIEIANKNISWPIDITTTRDFWLRQFYPQHYENKHRNTLPRKAGMVAINGYNRSNRQLFFDLLRHSNSQIPILDNIKHFPSVLKLNSGWFESKQDKLFRLIANKKYQKQLAEEPLEDSYYSKTVDVGINKKFGSIPPGYFIIPEYFENSCVIFPENSWHNNELTITEKASKCFYAGSLPFPIGGSNINSLFNKYGFYTAYNLLPDFLQAFDTEENHTTRFNLIIKAIDWLYNNKEVFESQEFFDYTNQNRMSFLDSHCCYIDSIKKLDNILTNEIY